MRARLLLGPFALALLACEGPSAVTAPLSESASASLPTSAPWPTPPAYDLAADIALRRALAVSHFGPRSLPDADGGYSPLMMTGVQDGVFVLASLDSDTFRDSWHRMHDALAALLHGRFSRPPSRAVTLYVFDDSRAFDYLCTLRLGRSCDSFLGVWIKETREIMVDQQLGKTTLVHELVHPLLAADAEAVPGGPPAWDAPRWVREGLASLFELPVLDRTEIHGATNWRLDDLRAAQASPTERELVHLDALFRMPDDLFDGDHARAGYAVARFACQWMDSPDQDRLWRFYRAWRAHAADDPSGEKSFAEVFGQTPHEADAAWQMWMRSLRKPG